MSCDESIRAQLGRVLKSAEFAASKRLTKFLCYVVERTLAGNAGKIKAYTIAVEAYGRKDFDAQDPYIRNIAGEVRRALKKYYLDQGREDPICIDIPKGTYVPEFTCVQVETDSIPPRTLPSVTPAVAHPLRKSSIERSLITAATTTTATTTTTTTTDANAALWPTVAVIPFTARHVEPQHEVLGEVVADDVILGLSRSDELQVISRLSTTVFRDAHAGLDEISTKLKANYVLSGSYRVLAGLLCLNVELCETSSGQVIWADNPRGSIDGIVRGNDGLVDQLIVETSKAVMSRELQRALSQPLITLDNYTLLMAAIRLMHRESSDDFNRARTMLETLTQRAGHLAVPHAWLAKWHVLRFNREQGWAIDYKRETQEALDCTRRALDADSHCTLALTINGLVHTNMLKEFDIGQEQYEHALQINPNDSLAWLLKGTLHAFKGEAKPAVDDTEHALRLSPLDPLKYYYDCLAATAALAAGDYQRALELAQRSLLLNRNHTSTLRTLAIAQAELDQLDQARQTVSTLMRLDPSLTVSSYLERSPSGAYQTGRIWSAALHRAGVPA
jgi:TolB-like protein